MWAVFHTGRLVTSRVSPSQNDHPSVAPHYSTTNNISTRIQHSTVGIAFRYSRHRPQALPCEYIISLLSTSLTPLCTFSPECQILCWNSNTLPSSGTTSSTTTDRSTSKPAVALLLKVDCVEGLWGCRPGPLLNIRVAPPLNVALDWE